MKTIAILLIHLFTSLFAAGQQYSFFKKLFDRPPFDSGYVESYYTHFLHFTLLSMSQNHQLSFSNPGGNSVIRYQPNNAFAFGVGIDYRYVSLEFTKTIDAIDQPDPQKGETDNFNLRLGITGRRFLASMLIQSYKGMYVSNAGEINSNYPMLAGVFPGRSDLRSDLVLGSLNYVFRHNKYSTMASLWQIDRQVRSAGSPIVGVLLSSNHIRGDSSLIPFVANPWFRPNERIMEQTNFLAGLNAGYGFNFIFAKYFFFNFLVIPGIDLQFGSHKTNDNVVHYYQLSPGYHADIRLIGGFNGIRYYGGLHYSNYFIGNQFSNDINLNLYSSYFRIFIGRRFDLTLMNKL